MKKPLVAAWLVLLTACNYNMPELASSPAPDDTVITSDGYEPVGDYNPGEVIVRFSDEVPHSEAQAYLTSAGYEVLHGFRYQRSYLVRLPDGMSVGKGIDSLNQLPGVTNAEPNYRLTPKKRR
jgi:hypothetical protein